MNREQESRQLSKVGDKLRQTAGKNDAVENLDGVKELFYSVAVDCIN
ncbi:hypothetical protein [Planococcus chinensis]|nr:hypothetical protein [Planococcus chinensis]